MHHIVSERGNEAISMIKSIIDEAMEKRDRTVSVYIHDDTMSVSVTPIGADEPRWIPKEGGYVCSTCGRWQINASRYCCDCGEALKNMDMFDEESEDDDCQSEESDRVKFCVMCKHNIISPGYNSDDPVCDHCTNQDKFEPYGGISNDY